MLALLILIFGPLAALETPTDIFPNIGVPVIGVAFNYAGMSPDDMSGRIITPYERILSTTVNDVEHVESQSMYGIGIVKIFFQPIVDIRTATAQVTSVSQTAIRQMPPGTQPPLILNYSASTVPVLQLAFSSQILSEQQVLDLTQNFVRPQLYHHSRRRHSLFLWRQDPPDPGGPQSRGHAGAAASRPSMCRTRWRARTRSCPAGAVKMGTFQYTFHLNDAAATIEDLNNLPVKSVNGATVYMRDVGHVRDGNAPQQSVVHVDGSRAVLTTILKNGSASTLDVVQGIKDMLPRLACSCRLR